MSTPPGWYLDPQDQTAQRWWDGSQWTQHTQPTDVAQPDSSAGDGALAKLGGLVQRGQEMYQGQKDARAAAEVAQGVQCRFEAQVAGANATVTVYTDRIEYMKPKNVSGGKVAAAVMTGGLSLMAGGVKNNKSGGTAVIPIRQISSVTSRNDGIRYSIMSVTSAGGAVLEFRSLKADIANAMPTIMRLVANGGQAVAGSASQNVVVNVAAPVAAPVVTTAEPATVDVHEQLIKLKSLLDAGVLNQEEYESKRAGLVSRL